MSLLLVVLEKERVFSLGDGKDFQSCFNTSWDRSCEKTTIKSREKILEHTLSFLTINQPYAM